MPYTPWITKSGNDTAKVLQIYLEKNLEDSVETFLPQSAEELLWKVIEIGRDATLNEKKAYQNNPQKLIPIRTKELHAFSLLLGHPTLAAACQQQGPPEEWINSQLIKPGQAIADTEFSDSMQLAVIDYCTREFLEESHHNDFKVEAMELNKPQTYYQFRNAILQILQRRQALTPAAEKRRIRMLDTFLYQQLPETHKGHLEASAIHFADTNWGQGTHDLHFCFVFNPGTAKLEIWEGLDNGTHLSALDQNELLFTRIWEFYRHPEEVFPSNEELHVGM